jgi:hypothetical protein
MDNFPKFNRAKFDRNMSGEVSGAKTWQPHDKRDDVLAACVTLFTLMKLLGGRRFQPAVGFKLLIPETY